MNQQVDYSAIQNSLNLSDTESAISDREKQSSRSEAVVQQGNPVAGDILHTELVSQGWMYGPIFIEPAAAGKGVMNLWIPKWVKALQLVELWFQVFASGATPAIHFLLDLVDRTVSFGGPWGASAVVGPLNLTPFLIDGKYSQPNGNHPISGRHQIAFTSADATTVIQAAVNIYGITQPAIGAPTDT